jgi:hypothetical protein
MRSEKNILENIRKQPLRSYDERVTLYQGPINGEQPEPLENIGRRHSVKTYEI